MTPKYIWDLPPSEENANPLRENSIRNIDTSGLLIYNYIEWVPPKKQNTTLSEKIKPEYNNRYYLS